VAAPTTEQRIILAAREAGDLAGHGGDRKINVDTVDLETFGIGQTWLLMR